MRIRNINFCSNIRITCHYIRTIIINIQELRQKLQKAIAEVVKSHREKSITKCSDEIAMGKSMWSDLEKGIKDPQVSTLWRIAEGLEVKPHVLVKEIEDVLGEKFSFLESTSGN